MAENKTLRAKQIERQPSIDLLRFIAAMMVATLHWELEVGSERYQRIYDVPLVGDLMNFFEHKHMIRHKIYLPFGYF